MKKPTRLVSFERTPLDLPKDKFIVAYGNARFFSLPRPKFDAVYAPSHPHIEEAYKCIGKAVYRPEGETPKKEEPVKEEVVENSSEYDPQDKEELSPSQWRELSWPKLRSLAKNYSDEPVKSKEQAEEIMLEAESNNRL